MAAMADAEVAKFLAADRHAILATNSPDGAPQLSPVWYIFEEGRIYVSATVETVKVRNLRRDPSVSLCIDGCRGDSRYVIVRGRAQLVEPDEANQEEMRWRIIRKYNDSDEAARRYYDMVRTTPAVLIVVEPDKVISQDYS
ncbi:MAG: PPOX class F420-dependent oxidoreductase [Caldilineaceae bacterium]|nr:PPOX class F420-dependent oxidoreductase [Caldilineaceae bacterium]